MGKSKKGIIPVGARHFDPYLFSKCNLKEKVLFCKHILIERPDKGLLDGVITERENISSEFSIGDNFKKLIGVISLLDHTFKWIKGKDGLNYLQVVYHKPFIPQNKVENDCDKYAWFTEEVTYQFTNEELSKVVEIIDKYLLLGRKVTADVFYLYKSILVSVIDAVNCYTPWLYYLIMKSYKLDNYIDNLRYHSGRNVIGMERVLKEATK